MKIDYSEYNREIQPVADNLARFIKGLNHAMEKTGDYAGAMHQLQCIGYDQALATVESVVQEYKDFHKQRIRTQYEAEHPSLADQYPTILPERLEQYAANVKLIEMINQHEDADLLGIDLADQIAQELDVDVDDLLKAYCDRDVDAMICALTGWNLESLLAKAKIIPDTKEYFYKPGDFDPSEIAFPFYGKESLTEEEFRAYLHDCYTLSGEAWRLIDNAIHYAKRNFLDRDSRTDYLWAMLEGTIDAPEEIVRMVSL